MLGSRTYEHALELGWPYGDTPTVVVTHGELPSPRKSVEVYSGDLRRLVEENLAPRFRNIWLVGGAMLCQSFLRLHFVEGDSAAARTDLDEAQEIAERGPMPLFLADIALYRGRLFGDREALVVAQGLIETHGYGRRLGELADAEAAMGRCGPSGRAGTATRRRSLRTWCCESWRRATTP